ncbi:1203_t:CDS:2 [Funneliformis caledonium]|uniref:1203_t:CDS:1 n=1 Tax=Funneliformis caledonium TaxID=1117310 RepID=A0A9N9B2Z6_9GLOM|nr:1203_t:CDS:2 [Funneliformis caledonium]
MKILKYWSYSSDFIEKQGNKTNYISTTFVITLFNLENNGLDLNGNQYVSLNKQRQYYVHNILAEKNHEALNLEQSEPIQDMNEQDDQENIGQIQNLIIRRPKGRPAGTVRFKGPLETSNEVNKSRKCGLCNESGHNRTTCPMNTNRKKSLMNWKMWALVTIIEIFFKRNIIT